MKKIIDKIEKSLNGTLIFLYFTILVVTFLQVLFRYVLNAPLIWSEELLRYVFIWATFIAAGVELGNGTHVRIDAVVSMFGTRLRKFLNMFAYILVAVFLIFVLVIGIDLVKEIFMTKSSALKIPFGLVYGALPVGSLIGIIFIIKAVFKKDK